MEVGDGSGRRRPTFVIDGSLGMALELAGKQVIAIGERDGVAGGALSACARAAGASVLLEVTHCFV